MLTAKQRVAGALWILGILILLVAIFWGMASSQGFRDCEQHQGQYPTSQNDYNKSSTVLVPDPDRIRIWLSCSGGFTNETGSAITAIATIILTLSTIALWFATRATAKIAERTLTDLERPWIHITDVDVGGIFGDSPYIPIETVNFGRVVGVVKGIEAGYRTSTTEPDISTIKMTRSDLEQVRNTVPPDKEYTSTIKLKPYRNTNVGVMISTGEAVVVLRAILHYEGLTRPPYETGFCFRYDAKSKCFLRHGGEKYNYTK
jgi:hypothetical protein